MSPGYTSLRGGGDDDDDDDDDDGSSHDLLLLRLFCFVLLSTNPRKKAQSPQCVDVSLSDKPDPGVARCTIIILLVCSFCPPYAGRSIIPKMCIILNIL